MALCARKRAQNAHTHELLTSESRREVGSDGALGGRVFIRYETPGHINMNKKGIEPDAPADSPLCPDPYPAL